jgi:mycofactocin system glycosyltransferase
MQGTISSPGRIDKYERRYRLAARLGFCVTQFEDKQTGLIYCRYPLYVSRTSPQIIALLEKCDGRRTVAEIARELGKKPESLLSALEGLRQRKLLELDEIEPLAERADWPGVSFVIPVYNRPVLLRRCLESIFALDYPPDKREVIVVDDSTDETTQVAASFEVRLLHNEIRAGSGAARNQGVAAVRFELVALIDSDCILEPDWLKRLVPLFDNPEQVAAAGAIRSVDTVSLIGRYEAVRSSLYNGEQPAEVTPDGALRQISAANLLVRKSAFEASGGHDPTLLYGDDVDLCWRLLETGGKFSYRPVTGVKHSYRTRLPDFLKTRFDYATGEAPLQLRYPNKRRVLALPGWYTPGLVGLLVWLSKPRSRWPWLLSCGPLLWKSWQKWKELKVYHTPLTPFDALASEGRSFLGAGYHLGQHLNRYYSLPLLLLALAKPRRMALPVALTLLGPAWGEYLRCKPRLNFPVFAALFLLENLFYQAGLIEGCRQTHNWWALFPKVEIEGK